VPLMRLKVDDPEHLETVFSNRSGRILAPFTSKAVLFGITSSIS